MCETPLDVLIIGGGIQGACICQKLARRGVNVGLVEKQDFAHATSANSLKILHGGLRYLQQANIKRMRESITSRNEMMKLAPHLIQPLTCMVPTYRHGLQKREFLRIALKLNDIIGWDRNSNLQKNIFLNKGRIISKKACMQRIPGINTRGISGAAIWYDALTRDTERLVLTYLKNAYQYGAGVANYTKVLAFGSRKKEMNHVRILDRISGEEKTITTRFIINAAGPWLDRVIPCCGKQKRKPQKWVKAVNLILNRAIFNGYAVGISGKNDPDACPDDQRNYFFVPWQNVTVIGTDYSQFNGNPDQLNIESGEVSVFIDKINGVYPGAKINLNDVSLCHVGIQPALFSKNKHQILNQPDSHAQIIDHGKQSGLDGVYSVKSVKYTTAPYMAERVCGILQKNGLILKRPVELHKMNVSLKFEGNPKQLALALRYKRIYGTEYPLLLNYIKKDERLGEPIDDECNLTEAEILFAIHSEMAFKLTDIVLRRTNCGVTAPLSQKIARKISHVMQRELNWDAARAEQGLLTLHNYYISRTVDEKY